MFDILLATSQEFQGNSDRYSVATEIVNPPIIAQYVRVKPKTWHRHISMRVEFYGCTEGKISKWTYAWQLHFSQQSELSRFSCSCPCLIWNISLQTATSVMCTSPAKMVLSVQMLLADTSVNAQTVSRERTATKVSTNHVRTIFNEYRKTKTEVNWHSQAKSSYFICFACFSILTEIQTK